MSGISLNYTLRAFFACINEWQGLFFIFFHVKHL